MNRREYVLELVTKIVGDKIKAEMVIDRLGEEGLLVLGYGDPDIDRIVTAFSDTFGTTKVSKYDRWAAGRLAAKYGSQTVIWIIKLLALNSTEKFAPVVNSVSELEQKWASVLNFVRNIKGNEEIKV